VRWRAAFRAAAFRTAGPFVRAAFVAARERSPALRFRAAERAWRESAVGDAAERGSRFSACFTARERRGDAAFFAVDLRAVVLRAVALRAVDFFAVDFLAVDFFAADLRALVFFAPRFGGGTFTPASRAFERPMAIACLVDRAPCFPSRMWCTSSRTNSPACVLGDFPSRASRRARSSVSRSGIVCSVGDG